MTWFNTWLSIFYLNDIVEIVLLSTGVFLFSRWCTFDKQKPLIIYFYAFCLGAIGLCALDLPTIHDILQVSWPGLFIVFIVLHEHTLQKNYIARKAVIPVRTIAQHDWIPLALRAGLKAAAHHKELIFVVQGVQVVDDFITCATVLNSPVSKELLDMLIESAHIKKGSLIMLDRHGTILGVNGSWKKERLVSRWDEYAVELTGHTDAVVYAIDGATRECAIVAHGACVTGVGSDKTELIIAQYVRKQRAGGSIYESKN